jgi:glycosyltransferase involved in cell wall biosynthesis
MRVLLLNTWLGGAVHNVLFPIYQSLKQQGVECDYITRRQIELDPNYDKTFSTYDVVHFGYFANIAPYADEIEVPFTCGVHHMPHDHASKYCGLLHEWSPRRIIVPEPFVARQLGQHHLHQVVQIPYAFDHSRWKPLPYPEQFTVGYLGCDYYVKRFDTIEQAAEMAGVQCKGLGRDTNNEEEGYKDDSDITKLYEGMSCYVVASFDDGGPLPPQEALLCGRPVVTTAVGMMPQVVAEGYNGCFHNGSVSDMARAITKVKDNFERITQYPDELGGFIPTIDTIGHHWQDMFEQVVEEAR